MGKLASRARQPLITAFVVAVAGQVLLIWFGNGLPDSGNLYGAPFPAGASIGYGGGQFWISDWIFDLLVTFAVLFAGAVVFHGKTVPGVIAAAVALFVAYVAYFVASFLQGSVNHTNQLVIWVWTMVVVLAVWAINRYSRPVSGVAESRPGLIGRLAATVQPYVRTAVAVAVLSQLLITCGGSLVPYKSDLYGAPLPVGESTPDLLFGSNPTFFPPMFILNILLTAGLLLAAATALRGTMRAGLISASVAAVLAYVTALASSEGRANQLLVWVLVLLVVAVVWLIRASRRVREKAAPDLIS